MLQSQGYILVSDNCTQLYRELCESSVKIAGLTPCFVHRRIFSDQEIELTVDRINGYINQPILLLIAFQNPNQNLIELFFILDHLRHELHSGALSNVTIFAPYFCYARSDKTPPHQPNPIRCLSSIIQQYQIQRFITLDLHSHAYYHYFSDTKFTNIDPSLNFCQILKELPELTLIAPDAGSSSKVQFMAQQLGARCILMQKTRAGNSVSFQPIQCTHQLKNCVIIDDILDTGSTILQILSMLKSLNPSSISVAVTHLLLSQNRTVFLQNPSIKHIYTTSSIQREGLQELTQKIQIIPITNLVECALVD